MSQNNFTKRALALVENGYHVIPIESGGKAPAAGKGWQNLEATPAMVRAWGSSGHGDANIGIITRHTPAVDIDIYDAEVADRMEQWVLDNILDAESAPRRVGRAPKRLLLFRADEPFRKQQAEFIDPQGQKHKLEVLGDGQQFVAYGIHPDTKRPFEWTTFDQPLDLESADLPLLTAEDARACVEEFERLCEELGWRRTSGSSRSTLIANANADDNADDNALLSFKRPLETTPEAIREALEYLSPDDGYDRWREVGMALHHQFDGGMDGLEIWDAWSQASMSYDRTEIEEKWPTFSETPDGRSPVTVATLFKYANDARSEQQDEAFERVLNVVRTTTDPTKLFKEVTKEVALSLSSDFQFDIAAKKLQERAKELTGVAPRIDTVRKSLQNARSKKADTGISVPDWCENWVYLENGDRFFSLETKQELTERGFNAKYDRECISPEDRAMGVASPEAHAAQKALNVFNIPTVFSTVYLPGFPRILEVLGRTRANTYDETSIPVSKEAREPEEFEAIRLVEQHLRMTFPDERERALVTDFFCYNVQFPSEKIAWALLMVGAEGAGKTWFLKLMQILMGPQNIAPLPAAALQEPTNNAWAEGSKMLFIEELRLHGSNRYEILDKLKEPVSNEDISIRRMNRDRYVIPNVTNYCAFTNYWDAVPVKKNNRRYLVVATALQSDDDVLAFNERYPNYFEDLFDAIYNHGAVLRGWAMSHKLSHWFEPKKPAPETLARRKMADLADVSDEGDALADLLDRSSHPAVTSRILTVEALRDAADEEGVLLPTGRALVALLTKAGFHSLGRLPIVDGTDPVRCFTREPGAYPVEGPAIVEAVRRAIDGNALPSPRDPLAFDEGEDVDPWS